MSPGLVRLLFLCYPPLPFFKSTACRSWNVNFQWPSTIAWFVVSQIFLSGPLEEAVQLWFDFELNR